MTLNSIAASIGTSLANLRIRWKSFSPALSPYDLMVLGALWCDAGDPLTSMRVRRMIEKHTGKEESIGTVTRTLAALQVAGYVASTSVPGGPSRTYFGYKIYRLTAKGLAYWQLHRKEMP